MAADTRSQQRSQQWLDGPREKFSLGTVSEQTAPALSPKDPVGNECPYPSNWQHLRCNAGALRS